MITGAGVLCDTCLNYGVIRYKPDYFICKAPEHRYSIEKDNGEKCTNYFENKDKIEQQRILNKSW